MEGQFRYAGTFLMLTYKGHYDKNEMKNWLTTVIGFSPRRIEIARESGDSEVPYHHCHVVIDFGKIFQTRDQRRFDLGEIHPHFKPLKGRKAFMDALMYISKEDPECSNLKQENNLPNLLQCIGEMKDEREVLLEGCRDTKDIIPLLTAFKHLKVRSKPLEGAPLRDNQKVWLKHLATQNDRQITWVFDPKGCSGKSWFARWMLSNLDCFFCRNGASRDIAHAWKGQTHICIDFTRDCEERINYGIIEAMKDGCVFSGKYDSDYKLFDPPKIIVMSNFHPDKKKMTEDRWDIIYESNEPWEEGVFDNLLLKDNLGTNIIDCAESESPMDEMIRNLRCDEQIM